ncbi:hypothetical protein MBT84_19150 [Streptomyces sp. MBT84]|uniref:SulP family inorganic anion transporter n=1 Tax=unclassified Streptomyces TaxID=2593676 RepID=UPI001DCF22F1|nr:hypothetical protein [Streptomyces sp. MBT84]
MVAFALIASAQSLFSAAAVDRLHRGKRTDCDRELMAQGWGTRSAGCSARCPMTAVIVHSAANVRAGARTKTSRVLHRVWLLVFTALLLGALAVIPVAALSRGCSCHVHVETGDLGAEGIVVRVLGHATFLRLPKLLDALETLPRDRDVRVELGGLRHLNHACAAAIEGWAAARGQEAVATTRYTS